MRLDVALVERGEVRSRNRAARLIAAGKVKVNGVRITKAAHHVAETDHIDAETEQWVSRAAYKLLGALEASNIAVPARVLDAGASTGGFTQVCLARGASRVYAVDVGHDQLVPELRDDPRVVVHEGLNLRNLSLEHLEDEPVDMVVGDVSFISLTMLMEPLLSVCRDTALLLVKPQFEVGREALIANGLGGVIVEQQQRLEAVKKVLDTAADLGWDSVWQGVSVLPGAHGNIEIFVALRRAAHAGA